MLEYEFSVPDSLIRSLETWIPDPGDALLFDIETTGLSWRRSHLYLLGALFMRENGWYLRQWLCQRPSEEELVLDAFSSLAKEKKLLVHFNGKSFDVPYLMHRYTIYQKPHPFSLCDQLDLFQQIQPFQKLLGMERMRQRDLEERRGIRREDPFSGKDLIACYQSYLRTGDERQRQILLLHNREDLTGMVSLLDFLWIPRLFRGKGEFLLQYEDCREQAVFRLTLSSPLPVSLDLAASCCRLKGIHKEAVLTVPRYRGTLKYFYENYREYYYLPVEDEAIHKSVGQYVDSHHRQKATASNCYRKVTGSFLPQKTSLFTPVFRDSIHSDLLYFQPEDTWFRDTERSQQYVRHLLASCTFLPWGEPSSEASSAPEKGVT